jgi:hypothetical protein
VVCDLYAGRKTLLRLIRSVLPSLLLNRCVVELIVLWALNAQGCFSFNYCAPRSPSAPPRTVAATVGASADIVMVSNVAKGQM